MPKRKEEEKDGIFPHNLLELIYPINWPLKHFSIFIHVVPLGRLVNFRNTCKYSIGQLLDLFDEIAEKLADMEGDNLIAGSAQKKLQASDY